MTMEESHRLDFGPCFLSNLPSHLLIFVSTHNKTMRPRIPKNVVQKNKV
jgi:hypothetical protein